MSSFLRKAYLLFAHAAGTSRRTSVDRILHVKRFTGYIVIFGIDWCALNSKQGDSCARYLVRQY